MFFRAEFRCGALSADPDGYTLGGRKCSFDFGIDFGIVGQEAFANLRNRFKQPKLNCGGTDGAHGGFRFRCGFRN